MHTVGILSTLAVPYLAFAAASVGSILTTIKGILDAIIPIIFVIALIIFLWGLAMWLLSAGDDAARAQARNIMIYGVIVLFVMISVWGLVRVLTSTFGLDTTNLQSGEIPGVDATITI